VRCSTQRKTYRSPSRTEQRYGDSPLPVITQISGRRGLQPTQRSQAMTGQVIGTRHLLLEAKEAPPPHAADRRSFSIHGPGIVGSFFAISTGFFRIIGPLF
jgi:hypothetical protein